MKQHWPEIARRTCNSYSWRLVEVKDDRQRTLAYSVREYGSQKKVRQAIAKLQQVVPDADVIDVCGPTERERFAVPASSFGLVSGVLPLVVGGLLIDHYSAVLRRREPNWLGPLARWRERPVESAEDVVSPPQPTVQQEVAERVPEPPAVPAAEGSPKRAPKGSGGQRSP